MIDEKFDAKVSECKTTNKLAATLGELRIVGLEAVVTGISFLCLEIDDLKQAIADLETEIKTLNKENQRLKSRIGML
jgi:FtsZ-binding cell division protein ZapB